MLYKIIYHPSVNKTLRNFNYLLSPILPKKIKINPSGTINIKIKDYNNLNIKANQTSYVAFKLFWNGSDNYEYTSIFKRLILKTNTFFDIGSSIGYFSLLAADVNPNIKIEAFEPSLGAMLFCSENVKINGFQDRINVNHLALSDVNGEIDFFEIRNSKYPEIYNLSGEHNLGTKNLPANKTKVESQTLDYFFENNQINQVDLMKIDTEGSEHFILKGGLETIKKYKPIIISELLFNRIEVDIQTILNDLGYSFYSYKANKLIPLKTLTREKDNGIRDIFCVHPDKLPLIQEFL